MFVSYHRSIETAKSRTRKMISVVVYNINLKNGFSGLFENIVFSKNSVFQNIKLNHQPETFRVDKY